MSANLLEGDALVRLAELGAGSVDACVTDPPYSLNFMGKSWDRAIPGEPYWREVLRVLKPGAHLVAFGGTRTYHRLTCAIEDAGFDIRDCLMWLYGSGFPKGKGCLKPGWEPIVLARKPAPKPWLNVNGCRIAALDGVPKFVQKSQSHANAYSDGLHGSARTGVIDTDTGRWPANVVLSHESECREVGTKRVKGSGSVSGDESSRPHTNVREGGAFDRQPFTAYPTTVSAWECVPECAVRLLDEQSGLTRSSNHVRHNGAFQSVAKGKETARESTAPADLGGASRFFYCSKASSAERRSYNDHPTVKPLALMQWLVRLVTPKGGTVLDPFMGSGSTLIAADREGFDAIGIDSDPHAVEIARRRIADDAGPLMNPIEEAV